MKTIGDSREMQRMAGVWRRAGYRIGLVPTMGYLHAGHLALVAALRPQCDRLVVSIFVNPTQFGPNEDLVRYPRDLDRDLARTEEAGVDVALVPAADTMYARDHSVYVDEARVSAGLCGTSREGHFRGVATVVTKLFNIVQPDVAAFGQKDAQQVGVIRRLVRDLNYPVDLVVVPTVRESDGLAMSSRNARLTDEQRQRAPVLYRALTTAKAACAGGQHDAARLRRVVRDMLGTGAPLRVEYVEIVEPTSMQPVETIAGEALLAVAVHIGDVRLIDNMMIAASSGA